MDYFDGEARVSVIPVVCEDVVRVVGCTDDDIQTYRKLAVGASLMPTVVGCTRITSFVSSCVGTGGAAYKLHVSRCAVPHSLLICC